MIMPVRGPTWKIARFQAELKFPSWTECGNIYKSFFGSFSKDLLLHTVDFTSPNMSEPENGKG